MERKVAISYWRRLAAPRIAAKQLAGPGPGQDATELIRDIFGLTWAYRRSITATAAPARESHCRARCDRPAALTASSRYLTARRSRSAAAGSVPARLSQASSYCRQSALAARRMRSPAR